MVTFCLLCDGVVVEPQAQHIQTAIVNFSFSKHFGSLLYMSLFFLLFLFVWVLFTPPVFVFVGMGGCLLVFQKGKKRVKCIFTDCAYIVS